MADSNYIERIAVLGATGNVGQSIVRSIASSAHRFQITAISRADKGTFKDLPSVSTAVGDYDSTEFLESALRGHDVLIVVLGFMSPPDVQMRFIEAAANVGVPWVLPCEFGSDNGNPRAEQAVSFNAEKRRFRERVEQLGKSSWIGVVTNPWLDMLLPMGAFGIDINERKVEFYDDGNTKMNTTTIPQVGRAVANLLSLPVKASQASQPALSDYKNDFVYVSSFLVSQREILEAVQAAIGNENWTTTFTPVDEVQARSQAMVDKGDFHGFQGLLMASMLDKTGAGNYEESKGTSNYKLGLPTEDLHETVRTLVN